MVDRGCPLLVFYAHRASISSAWPLSSRPSPGSCIFPLFSADRGYADIIADSSSRSIEPLGWSSPYTDADHRWQFWLIAAWNPAGAWTGEVNFRSFDISALVISN